MQVAIAPYLSLYLWQDEMPYLSGKNYLSPLKTATNIKNHSLYFSSFRRLYKCLSWILKFFLKHIAIHVLENVRI